MTALKVHNDQARPVQLLLEPSGYFFEMPAGAVFEILPQRDAQLEIYHQDPDLMVSGAVAKVIHDGEVLATWDEPQHGAVAGAAPTATIGSVEELQRYLLGSGEQISAKHDGALLFRELRGKSWVARVQWRDQEGVVHIEAAPGINAPLERESALALTISRIHARLAIPGFQILRSASRSELELTYWMVLMLDERRSIATSVLSRATNACFDAVVRNADRLQAVAQGNPDPDAASC